MKLEDFMKNFYQKATILLGLSGVMSLTACSNAEQTQSQTQTTEPTVAQTTTTSSNGNSEEPRKLAENFVSKLPDIAPTYKVITTGSMPPFSFYNEKGELMGLDIDAMHAIAEAGGFKVKFYTRPWQGMFDAVEKGQYDLSASGISYTHERAKTYGLSNSYFFNPSAIMVKEGAVNVQTLADLKDLRIAGMKESKQIEQAMQVGATNMTGYDTNFLAFQALVQNHQDVVLQDEPFLRHIAKQYPDHKVKIIPYEDKNEPSAHQIILMKKDNRILMNQVNKGIDIVVKNGQMQKIEEKWLGKKS